jgi:hypothetical protein
MEKEKEEIRMIIMMMLIIVMLMTRVALPSSHQHASSARSDRRDGGSERSAGGDLYMEQVVDSMAFLAAAFQTWNEPFLSVKVAAVDAPFLNVLLSPETPWQGKPRDADYNEIVNRMRTETDAFEQMTLISQAPYAVARSTTSDMTHAAMRVPHSFVFWTFRRDSLGKD